MASSVKGSHTSLWLTGDLVTSIQDLYQEGDEERTVALIVRDGPSELTVFIPANVVPTLLNGWLDKFHALGDKHEAGE